MNSNVTSPVIKMDREELRKLTTEVKETLATDAMKSGITVVDLWNIQRNRKTQAIYRRRALL